MSTSPQYEVQMSTSHFFKKKIWTFTKNIIVKFGIKYKIRPKIQIEKCFGLESPKLVLMNEIVILIIGWISFQ